MASKVPYVDRADEKLILSFPYDPSAVASVRSLGRAKWHPTEKTWEIPYSQATLERIQRMFPGLTFGNGLKEYQSKESENLLESEERKYLPTAKNVEITDFVFKTEPMWHQKVTFNFARSLDCSAIFLEQGLGKTKVYIDLATWRFRQKQIRVAFVVAPNSVTGNWGEEIEIHGHDDFKKYLILEGSSTKKIKQLEKALADNFQGFIITNYESLKGLWEALIRMQGGKAKLFQMMGLDESSKIKHAQSKRSQYTWKIGRTVKYRNIMTGTPITQNGEDIFGQYRFLKEDIFGPYATAFRGQYLIMGGFEMRQVIGYRNFPDFLKKVYQVAIRFTKDRCLNLPAKVYQKRAVRLDEETSKLYRQLEKECVAVFSGSKISAPLVMTKLMKLSQITGGFVYEQNSSGERIATHVFENNPKIMDLEEFLEEIGGKKTIIWSRFTQEIKVIESLMQRLKIKYVSIHGGVSREDRDLAKNAFQEDPSVQVLVGQSSTAGLGITLTKAHYSYYYSSTYSLEDRLQTEDRPHRIGLDHTIVYVDCLAETHDGRKTIDHDIMDVWKGKNMFANEVSMALIQKMVQRAGPVVPETMRNPAHVRNHAKNVDPIFEEETF